MALLVADQVAEQMISMIKIEDSFILNTLVNLGEVDKLVLDVLFTRLHDNSQILGNLALVLRNSAVKAVAEMQMADAKLQHQEKGDG